MEENKTTVTETKQQDKGLSQIQPNEKRSWWSIAFIWVGTMICIPMLMVGGIFGGVLTMGSIFWATLIGFAICCTMMILGGIVGSFQVNKAEKLLLTELCQTPFHRFFGLVNDAVVVSDKLRDGADVGGAVTQAVHYRVCHFRADPCVSDVVRHSVTADRHG